MVAILGLGSDITRETLIASRELWALNFYPRNIELQADLLLYRHNQLPSDHRFPSVDVRSTEFKGAGAIIAGYKAHNHFWLRLLHRHTKIPEGRVQLRNNLQQTCATSISDINLKEIHGHIFSVKEGSFFPSEFCQGPPCPNDADTIDKTFFEEFLEYLKKNKLQDVLGLERKQGCAEPMVEISSDNSSFLLSEQAARDRYGKEILQDAKETTWAIEVKDGVLHFKATTRCVWNSTRNQHMVVV